MWITNTDVQLDYLCLQAQTIMSLSISAKDHANQSDDTSLLGVISLLVMYIRIICSNYHTLWRCTNNTARLQRRWGLASEFYYMAKKFKGQKNVKHKNNKPIFIIHPAYNYQCHLKGTKHLHVNTKQASETTLR